MEWKGRACVLHADWRDLMKRMRSRNRQGGIVGGNAEPEHKWLETFLFTFSSLHAWAGCIFLHVYYLSVQTQTCLLEKVWVAVFLYPHFWGSGYLRESFWVCSLFSRSNFSWTQAFTHANPRRGKQIVCTSDFCFSIWLYQ